MISYIQGKILKIFTSKDCYVDILTQSGIGYRIYTTKKENIIKGDTNISFYTYFHVREDNQTLFGFVEETDRDFFEKLLSVSGVGPKLALSILSTYSREEIEKMILEGNDSLLSKTPGLGSKGAQKIILELRGKIDFKKSDEIETDELKDLKNALKSLGFSGEILNAKVTQGKEIYEKQRDIDIEELLKKVLSE